MLLDIDSVEPQATETKLLLKMHCSALKRDRATPRTYTAPPPPLVEPGLFGQEMAVAEHDEKLESEIKTVKSPPPDAAGLSGENKPLLKRANCGD
jgi:hypothetical protein